MAPFEVVSSNFCSDRAMKNVEVLLKTFCFGEMGSNNVTGKETVNTHLFEMFCLLMITMNHRNLY
jgi:hypothetical protein